MPTPLYFDYNATAPLRPASLAAMTEAWRTLGNPSSVHRFGRMARRAVEGARETLAAHLGVAAGGLIFTSGGTEANNLALRGLPGRRLLVSAVEHPSVLKGPVDAVIPVDGDGRVDLAALEAQLRQGGPALVSVMLANNETGVIQPIAAVARLVRAHGGLLHGDGVQALGKLAIDMNDLDLLTLSAHKIGGPQGVGALVLRDAGLELAALSFGGGQERRLRPGTENVAGIVGFAAALGDLADIAPEAARQQRLRDRLEQGCRAVRPDLRIFAVGAPRLANTSCFALPGIAAQTLLMALDLEGVAVGAGSACSSGKLGPSPVLAAMGAGEWAAGAIRVSLGWASAEDEIEQFLERFGRVAARLEREHRAA